MNLLNKLFGKKQPPDYAKLALEWQARREQLDITLSKVGEPDPQTDLPAYLGINAIKDMYSSMAWYYRTNGNENKYLNEAGQHVKTLKENIRETQAWLYERGIVIELSFAV